MEDKNKLDKLLGRQFLILAFIEERLNIVNYIMNGYDNNESVLMNNRFLHFTSHIYYRSIIIDLASLYIKNDKTNKNTLHKLYYDSKVTQHMKEEDVTRIKSLLYEVADKIKIIEVMRHNELAHYSFNDGSKISFNHKHLPLVNELFGLGTKILLSLNGFDFNHNNSYLSYLEHTVADLRKVEPSKTLRRP